MNAGRLILFLIVLFQVGAIVHLVSSTHSIVIYPDDAVIPQQYIQYTAGAIPYLLKPNLSVTLSTTGPDPQPYRVDTNGLGLRDDDPPAGTNDTRIAVVGDSMTFGWGINKSSRFTERCERTLIERDKQVSTINAGIPGYGMDDYRSISEGLVLDMDPDILVVVFSRGDYHSVSRDTPDSDVGLGKYLEAGEKLYQRQLSGGIPETMRETMDEISSSGRENGVQTIFLSYWPLKPHERERMDTWASGQRATSFAASPQAFREHGMDDFIFSSADPHLNYEANAHLADTLCGSVISGLSD